MKLRYYIERFLCFIFGHLEIIQDDPYRFPCRFCNRETIIINGKEVMRNNFYDEYEL